MTSSFTKLFMRPSMLSKEEQTQLGESIRESTLVYVIRKKAKEKVLAPFNSIREGDRFFVGGTEYKCGTAPCHYNGPRYQGFILFDVDGQVWYPNNLDGKGSAGNE